MMIATMRRILAILARLQWIYVVSCVLILLAQAQLVAPQSRTHTSDFFPPHSFTTVLRFSWRLVQPHQALEAPVALAYQVGPCTRVSSV